jgi:hypothetical protein
LHAPAKGVAREGFHGWKAVGYWPSMRESRIAFEWERLLDLDVLMRCRLLRLRFDKRFVECDCFATAGSAGAPSTPALDVEGGTASGLS